jgi:hypothetical protein
MDGEGSGSSGARSVLMWIVVGIVGFFLLRGLLHSDSNPLKTTNCATHLEYIVPKEELKGVPAQMTAERCSDSSETGKSKNYVLMSVSAKGETSDKSKVESFGTTMRLDYQQHGEGSWEMRVPPNDVTETPVVSGDSLSYASTKTWKIRPARTRIKVVLVLVTDKGKPTEARHTFYMP